MIETDPHTPPRVTIIIDSFFHVNAGTENQLAKIVSGLSSIARIEIITLRDSPWLRENASRLGVEVTLMRIDGVRTARTYRNLAGLVRHLRRTKPRVVHTFFPISNIVGVIAARLAGVQTIYSSRRDYGEWMSGRYLLATRMANRFASGIIANSSRVAQLTVKREMIAPDRVKVIHNGIDLSPFAHLTRSPDVLAKLGIPADAKILGLVANYRPMKRQETLVRALPLVLRRHPQTHVIFVGQNMTPEDIESRVRETARSLGVDSHVHQVHADGNVVDFLGVFDIGINCSEGEGLSNAMMEYMAGGIAVIASASGGNPDLITHSQNGLLFPLDDECALAEAISELLASDVLREQLACTARQYVAREFSIPAMLAKFAVQYGLRPSEGLPVNARVALQ